MSYCNEKKTNLIHSTLICTFYDLVHQFVSVAFNKIRTMCVFFTDDVYYNYDDGYFCKFDGVFFSNRHNKRYFFFTFGIGILLSRLSLIHIALNHGKSSAYKIGIGVCLHQIVFRKK